MFRCAQCGRPVAFTDAFAAASNLSAPIRWKLVRRTACRRRIDIIEDRLSSVVAIVDHEGRRARRRHDRWPAMVLSGLVSVSIKAAPGRCLFDQDRPARPWVRARLRADPSPSAPRQRSAAAAEAGVSEHRLRRHDELGRPGIAAGRHRQGAISCEKNAEKLDSTSKGTSSRFGITHPMTRANGSTETSCKAR